MTSKDKKNEGLAKLKDAKNKASKKARESTGYENQDPDDTLDYYEKFMLEGDDESSSDSK
jgi:hypothetical protein